MSQSPVEPTSNSTLDVIDDMPVQALLDHFAAQGVEIKLPIDELGIIQHIRHLDINGGANGKGEVITEMAIDENAWFFRCHFPGDPVMPGCLGLDAMWQLVGFFLGWSGGPGKGRALGVGEVKFKGQILPTAKKVTYRIDFKRVIKRKLFMGLADGTVSVDGRVIYTANDLKVGLFQDTSSF